MKITNESLELNDGETVFWKDIQKIHLVNGKLMFFLKDGQTREIVEHIHPSLVEAIFRAYEHYVQVHPSKAG